MNTLPHLSRQCPLCAGPMSWCGEVPTDDMPMHPCHQITCVKCDYNVDFNLTDSPARDLDLADLCRVIAAKWNGSEAA
jgi:hypothetical protein